MLSSRTVAVCGTPDHTTVEIMVSRATLTRAIDILEFAVAELRRATHVIG